MQHEREAFWRAQSVNDELFARIKVHFTDKQLVEITALLTVVNLDRFNAAFGIGSAGFSEGMVCVPPGSPAKRTGASHNDHVDVRACRATGARRSVTEADDRPPGGLLIPR